MRVERREGFVAENEGSSKVARGYPHLLFLTVVWVLGLLGALLSPCMHIGADALGSWLVGYCGLGLIALVLDIRGNREDEE